MPLNNGPAELKALLTGSGGKKVLFVGIGNVLRKDDGVGVYISRRIIETDVVKTLTVEVSIENYIGKINALKPDHLILIDCTDLRRKPGNFILMPLENIADHTFNTHNISLSRIREFFPITVHLLAVQPKQTDFGESLSPEVKTAANKIIRIIHYLS